MSSIPALFTQCIPSPFAGVQFHLFDDLSAEIAERDRRTFSPERIEHADAELYADVEEPRFAQDADMFPEWEPDGDELQQMFAEMEENAVEAHAYAERVADSLVDGIKRWANAS